MTGIEGRPGEFDHVQLVHGTPDGENWLALVLKQTYLIREDGSCVRAEEQESINEDIEPYEDVEPPNVSSPKQANDCFAFKPATDLVVQGFAHTYGSSRSRTDVSVELRGWTRTIRVYGDRRYVKTPGGNLRFSEPEPFESLPITYDRAFGGCDRVALDRHKDPAYEAIGSARPEWMLGTTTRFHYPRNPAGTGFIVESDPAAWEGVRAPNLEYPEDPVTPDRVIFESYRQWPRGPLPACLDWCHQAWFPRTAYLGLLPEYDESIGSFREIEWGWVPNDLLESGSILDLQVRNEFAQAATPGLTVPDFRPDESLRFTHLFPDEPVRAVRLPGHAPVVEIHPKWNDPLDTESRLNSVVFRPDESRVILTWSARARVHRPFAGEELDTTPFTVEWTRV